MINDKIFWDISEKYITRPNEVKVNNSELFQENFFIQMLIIEQIKKNFPQVEVVINFNSDYEEYSVIINDRELYNSQKYQKTIMDLKTDLLWSRGILNYRFVFKRIPSTKSKDVFKIIPTENCVANCFWEQIIVEPIIVEKRENGEKVQENDQLPLAA